MLLFVRKSVKLERGRTSNDIITWNGRILSVHKYCVVIFVKKWNVTPFKTELPHLLRLLTQKNIWL